MRPGLERRRRTSATGLAWLAVGLLLATSQPASADASRATVHVLHCGRVLDVVSGSLSEQGTIVVEGKRIRSVESGYLEPPDGAVRIDLSDHTCLPGLMDMHVHLTSEYSRSAYVDRFRLDAADRAIRAVVHAERTLRAGFTTVRNLGDANNVVGSLRDAIDQGLVPGPRIWTAGKSLATTGGHADPTNGARADLFPDPGPVEGVVNGVVEARKAVRQRYKDGADLIKITATGGVLSVARSGENAQFTEEEITEIVRTANDYGFHVAAHAHGAEGMKRAVRAGVRTIEHGTFMDAETMELMKERGTWYVPTIIAGRWVAEKSAIEGFFPELVRPKAAAIGPQIQDTFGKAWRAGVKIAFGTDSGVSAHGDNAREFEYMVEAGMPAIDAIRSATLATSELLGWSDRLGTLEAGKLADVVAAPGNPLEDVTVLQRIAFVMKDGRVYRQP